MANFQMLRHEVGLTSKSIKLYVAKTVAKYHVYFKKNDMAFHKTTYSQKVITIKKSFVKIAL